MFKLLSFTFYFYIFQPGFVERPDVPIAHSGFDGRPDVPKAHAGFDMRHNVSNVHSGFDSIPHNVNTPQFNVRPDIPNVHSGYDLRPDLTNAHSGFDMRSPSDATKNHTGFGPDMSIVHTGFHSGLPNVSNHNSGFDPRPPNIPDSHTGYDSRPPDVHPGFDPIPPNVPIVHPDFNERLDVPKVESMDVPIIKSSIDEQSDAPKDNNCVTNGTPVVSKVKRIRKPKNGLNKKLTTPKVKKKVSEKPPKVKEPFERQPIPKGKDAFVRRPNVPKVKYPFPIRSTLPEDKSTVDKKPFIAKNLSGLKLKPDDAKVEDNEKEGAKDDELSESSDEPPKMRLYAYAKKPDAVPKIEEDEAEGFSDNELISDSMSEGLPCPVVEMLVKDEPVQQLQETNEVCVDADECFLGFGNQ